MPPATLPADPTLKPSIRAAAAWAAFDPAWYLQSYPSVRECLSHDDPDAARHVYLETGQMLGHSPNRYFDEAWHRRAYPDVAAALGRNAAASGFDLYCRGGFRSYSPHWLFDERLYRQRYPDLAEEVLAAAGMANGYDHYLRHGAREMRIGHLFFDPALYLAQLDEDEAREAAAAGPFHRYLTRIAAGPHEARTTLYFDPEWYLAKYPSVSQAIARGLWHCALHHYLANETPSEFDPLPEFSETYYQARYPDVAAAVGRAEMRNGYRHFLAFGATERRSPSATIDLRYYAGHDAVQTALRDGATPDPFTHYIAVGRAAGLAAIPPPEERVSEGQAKTLFRRKATTLLPLFGRHPIDFTCNGQPALTVIMVAHNRFAITLQTLASLRSNYSGDIELVLVDSGSTDEVRYLDRYVHGATVVRFAPNIGFLRSCNVAFEYASAPAVLLLNNDLELAPGAVAVALDRLMSDRAIGAVGGKVVRTHGLLQEAGNIVWADGTTSGYMRDASPSAPEANFVRDVDFCSAVFLMLRRSAVQTLGGFDEAFAPAYYEDADFCLRLAAVGLRVVYDPSVVIHHLEYGSARDALESEAAIGRNREIFRRKHHALLERRPQRTDKAELAARTAGAPKLRILFIEDTVPLHRLGSGFVRSNQIARVMAALGYQVTVFPINGSDCDLAAVVGDMPDTVEIMHDRSILDLPAFLASRQDYYDVLWIARTHNLDRMRDNLGRPASATDSMPRIILDTEAIAAQRTASRSCLLEQGQPFDLYAAVRQEFANADVCERVVVVNAQDACTLRDLGISRVSIIGHMCEPKPTHRPFEARSGMLFVGAIHDVDSPNYDSLCWFVDDVLPLIEGSLGWETRLTVVAYTGRQVSLERFRHHPRITLMGTLENTEHVYDRHRVFVAPTRYAAGMPYKVQEAASFGVPVVATDLLCHQMAWEDGRDLLVADRSNPKHFADLVVRLYRDAQLWQRLRDGALERLRLENSLEQYATDIQAVLRDCAPALRTTGTAHAEQ
jgi:O-antigen biosynthesis protein